MVRSLFGSLILAACWLTTAVAEDWPTYMHDNTRVGATGETLKMPLSLRWIHNAPAATESAWEGPRSSPIEGQLMKHRVRYDDANHVAIVGDKVFFGSSVDHQMRCVNADSGDAVWSFCTGGPIRLAPTVWNGKVYFGSDDGLVYCLNAESGEVVWKHRVGPKDERLLARGRMISRWPVRSSVLIADGIAYFGAGIFPHETVYLGSADAETGEIEWLNDRISQRNAGRDDLSPQGYLLANAEQLFVPSGRTMPAAFNRKTGEFVFKKSFSWRSSGGGIVGGSKALLSDGQLYSSGPQHFIGLNEKTGNAGLSFIQGTQMTFAGDMAYITTGKEVIAVNRDAHTAASVEWQKLFVSKRSIRDAAARNKVAAEMKKLTEVGIVWKAPTNHESAITVTGGHVFSGGIDEVSAYDIKTGEKVFTAPVEGEARGLAVANGSLLVSTTAGKIYAFGDAQTKLAETGVAKHPAELTAEPYPKDELSDLYASAAEAILKQSNPNAGFCLVLGSEQGRLAYELAKRSSLRIYGIEPDADKVAASRKALLAAGLYGHRISIVHAQPAKTPLSNYFADLVVSDSMLLTGELPTVAYELGRYVKPCGGIACFGAPAGSKAANKIDSAKLKNQLAEIYLRDDAKIESTDQWTVLHRGKLAEVGEWSHQYGGVDNACFSNDHRLKGSLGVLWYGDPGPQETINRHEAAAAPLSTNGRFFTQGVDSVRAYDAYNGRYLWEYKNPGAIRTGVFNNQETSNLAATDDTLFVAVKNTCTAINAATGEVRHVFKAPASKDGAPRDWGFVAAHNGLLFGTSTIHSELAASLRRRGRTVASETDAIFAFDPQTGKMLWKYEGENLMHVTITMSEDRLFVMETSITQEERDTLLREDKSELAKLTGEAKAKKEAELKALDVRRVVAIDQKSGEVLWREPVEITFVSGVSAGGGNVAMMYQDGNLLVCGANANGHYWRQFLSGEFKKRRLVNLNADTGKEIWARDADYMNRPAIINNMVLAEPWAFDLKTGAEQKRVSPITGEETNWQYSRPGHHCGVVTATPNMMFFRSGFIGYYDLYEDSGTRHFAGQRLGCWVNALPANGLLVIPEASAGCVCLFSITSTVVLEPREDRAAAWGIYSVSGSQTPVKKLAVNLGAPGDRRDQFGTLWLGYPRPSIAGRMEYKFTLPTKFATGGGFYMLNDESTKVDKADTPWLYASGARKLTQIELPLLGKDDPAAKYNVKLHFASIADEAPSQAPLTIKLQGEVVADDLAVEKSAGGANQALVKTFENVNVTDKLTVEVTPSGDAGYTLSAIEVERVE